MVNELLKKRFLCRLETFEVLFLPCHLSVGGEEVGKAGSKMTCACVVSFQHD